MMGICNENAVCLVEKLRQKGWHITTAESCTGGMVASGIVDVSGASEVFEEGYVTYSDWVKHKLLGVRPETLERFTAVSKQAAEEMALGAAQAAEVELSVAVTGYAGPEDAEDGTPAGTVYIGTCLQGAVETRKFHFSGDRDQVRRLATKQAYQFALERIKQGE